MCIRDRFEVLHTVVLHHLGAAAHKGVKIFLVGELEIADLVVRDVYKRQAWFW